MADGLPDKFVAIPFFFFLSLSFPLPLSNSSNIIYNRTNQFLDQILFNVIL